MWPSGPRGAIRGRLWSRTRVRPQPGELCDGWSQLVASQRTSVALVGAGLLGGRGWVRCGFEGVEEGGLEEQEEGVVRV